MTIDKVVLSTKKETNKEAAFTNRETGDRYSDQTEMETNNINSDVTMKEAGANCHDLNDRHLITKDNTYTLLLPIQKFDGLIDAELWLKGVLEKFELGQLSSVERNDLIPEILAGEALI
jgi:hypothetical protein